VDTISVEAWLFVRGVVAASFLLAGLAKLLDLDAFERSLNRLALPGACNLSVDLALGTRR